PIIRNMADYIYKTHISDNYFVNVADAHPEVNPEPVMLWRFGYAIDDKDMQGLGASFLIKNRYYNVINQTFHRMRELFDLISVPSVVEDKQPFHESKEAWLPQVQMMTVRLSNDLFIAAHGGTNGESHNHNDVGDFIVYANGDPVIIDVGSGTYTARTFSKD